MKKIVTLSLILFLFHYNSYAGDIDLPHITVFGTATTKVTPDQISWYLTIKNKGSVLNDVAEKHTKIVEEVLHFLKGKKVPIENTQTADMEFKENWEYKNNTRVKEGYFASTSIYFKINDLKKYKPLWIGLSKIKNVSVDGVNYDHSKRIEYQNETRKKALLVAKEKAVTLAKTIGSEIGKPLLIEDMTIQKSRNINRYSNIAITAQDDPIEGDSIAPGKIPIRMRVKLAFQLMTHD